MEKILQFGEGNFLRAFIEDYIQDANSNGYNGSVVICQPRKNNRIINALNNQKSKYDIIIRGKMDSNIIDERKTITCVSKCIDTVNCTQELIDTFCSDNIEIIVSNTTEAGICYCESDKEENFPNISYPAKVTWLLKQRFDKNNCGLIFFPVELIENNGFALKECIIKYAKLWKYPNEFFDYLDYECSFCNTLVDRIVTGHNDNDFDLCSVCCEPFKSLIIQCDEKTKSKLPFNDKSVIYTNDLQLYRMRKVRILNGVHTISVLGGYLKGFDIVRDLVNDEYFSDFINNGIDEIISTIPLDNDKLYSYSNSVLERFNNPFIDHKLLDISLNSISKFKSRVLPSIIDYSKNNGTSPKYLSISLAYLIAFYNHKSNRNYVVNDSKEVLDFFANKPSIEEVLDNVYFWDIKLTSIPNLKKEVEDFYETI